MNPLDELPRRDRNHEIEDEAIAAFQMRLSESGAFILQANDRKDYGTDCQIEVTANGSATNVRVHVQLKGTERELNADGSLSIDVRRTNLNYLLMQPYSIYVAYHAPTCSLRIRTAENIAHQYEHAGTNWTEQRFLTASFVEDLSVERLDRLADLARAEAMSSRDWRFGQVSLETTDLTSQVLESQPAVHVPEEPAMARELLVQLYGKSADKIISAGFNKFAAVLGDGSDDMGICYMSEINLGMDRMSRHPERIEAAINFFRARLVDCSHRICDLHFTIGNACHALGNEQAAKNAFDAALADPELAASPAIAAQVHKNLGTSHELLGNHTQAVEHYREALRLDPNLAEAHTALGIHYVRQGQYTAALHHLDQVIFTDQKQGWISAVSAWRANALFNLADSSGAFREINGLVAQANRFSWIWPWCCRLVASFGRANVENARHALLFWQRYVKAHRADTAGGWELLMTTFYLRNKGIVVAKSYSEFLVDFDRHIANIDASNASLPWDRLGHWAQDNDDWVEAERCFRKAYELAGSDYGYCLAVALNHLNRFHESVLLLQEQSKLVQPDAMSWFQLATGYANLGRWKEAINAYENALSLDPNYDLAMFDLGGAHWNGGDKSAAAEVWKIALERFPGHKLSARLQGSFPGGFEVAAPTK